MKFTLLFLAGCVTCMVLKAQNTFPSTGAAGIGTTTPNASALLEIKSTTKGLLIPRMNKGQRDLITSPATGLMIYQNNATPGFYYYDGSVWKAVSGKSSQWITSGNNIYYNNGNVGIGTTTPGFPLSIQTGTSGIYPFQSANGLVDIRMYQNTSLAQIGTYSNHPFQLMAANGINQLVLLPNGNVGIGTATPSALMDVKGDALINGFTVGRGGGDAEDNLAIGYKALFSNIGSQDVEGYYNIAIGLNALTTNTEGFSNTAVGWQSMFSNTTGYHNTAVGDVTMLRNTTGFANTATGNAAMYSNTEGYQNTALGDYALSSNTSGDGNTAHGYFALANNITGNNNTACGWSADVSTSNLSNAMALGYTAKVNASNKVVVGNSSVTVIGGQVGWSAFSDGRFKKDIKQNVPGLEFINKLKPVTYHIEIEKFEKFLGGRDSVLQQMKEAIQASEKKLRTGLIAQEVEKAAKDIKYDFDGVNVPQNEKDNYSLVYADFVPSLIKAVQELSVQNDSLKKENQKTKDDLQKQIDDLKRMIVSSDHPSLNTSTSLKQQTVDLGSAALLSQNIPNPFKNLTIINYYLPVNNDNAYINFYNGTGALLKSAKIRGVGKGSISIKADELPAGSYRYVLLIDGKMIDSKQMEHLK